MSGYVGKISVRSDTSFIHHTVLLNYPNWTVLRKKVILLLSHYWVLSLTAVFLRFNWKVSLGVDDLGFDSFIYVPLPQSHRLIRFVNSNSLFTLVNGCICDSLLVWHMFLVSVTVYLTLLLRWDKGDISTKNIFRSFPLSIPFLSRVLADVSLTICLVLTWPN